MLNEFEYVLIGFGTTWTVTINATIDVFVYVDRSTIEAPINVFITEIVHVDIHQGTMIEEV